LPGSPLLLMRQVQIVAGSLLLLSVVLGALVAPIFYILSGFVGAGLIFAGTTGFCSMARLLAFMPWNRSTSSSGAMNCRAELTVHVYSFARAEAAIRVFRLAP
jgi:hypothetical protein